MTKTSKKLGNSPTANPGGKHRDETLLRMLRTPPKAKPQPKPHPELRDALDKGDLEKAGRILGQRGSEED